MDNTLRDLLAIPYARLDAVNEVLLNPDTKIINAFLDVVKKYGTPAGINRKARKARSLENLFAKVNEKNPEYIRDLQWLQDQAKSTRFVSVAEYGQKFSATRQKAYHLRTISR